MEQLDQPPPDIRIVAVPLVAADVGAPQVVEPGRLGPQAQHVVVVVLEHDAAADPDRSHHGPHHALGIRHVLENEARVGDVEAPPLVGGEVQRHHVAGPQLEQMLLAVGTREPPRLRDLLGAALDPEHAAGRRHRTRHGARELPEPRAQVEHAIAGAEAEGAERRLVHEIVQRREAALLVGRGSVHVPGVSVVGHGVVFSRGAHRRQWPGRRTPTRQLPAHPGGPAVRPLVTRA